MKLLALDTSTELATVALTHNNTVYCEQKTNMRQHAQFLIPMIDQVLSQADLKFNQLDGIVFGRGPGSFTGLRITCSIAKALAFAHDLPVYPVSTLAAIAYQVYQVAEYKTTQVIAMLDARMHQIYWGCFKANSYDVVEQVSHAYDVVLDAQTPCIIAGTGLDIYLHQLPESVQSRLIKTLPVFPTAEAMLYLVKEQQIKPVSAEEALPVYIRNQVTYGS